jgi:hypothetical protein
MFGYSGNSEPDPYAKIAPGLREFLKMYLQSRVDKLTEKIGKVRKQIEASEQKRHNLARSAAEFNRDFAQQTEALSDTGSFAADFERLCALEGVGVVMVDPTQRALIIRTKTLYRVLNPSGNPQRFDIGQKEVTIRLRPGEGRSGNISVRPGAYMGPFTHVHLEGDSICWGPQLNENVDRLVRHCMVAPLVQLMLTFFRMEESLPAPRKDFGKPESVVEPSYASDEDRAFEKKRFVDMMREVVSEQLSRLLESQKQANAGRAGAIERYAKESYDLRMRKSFMEKVLQSLHAERSRVDQDLKTASKELYDLGVTALTVTSQNPKLMKIEFLLRVRGRDPIHATLHANPWEGIMLTGVSEEHPALSVCESDGRLILPDEVLSKAMRQLAHLSVAGYLNQVITYVCSEAGKIKPGGGHGAD